VPAKRSEKLVSCVIRPRAPVTQMVKSFLAARDLKGKLAALASIQKDIDLFSDPKTELIPVFQDISDSARKGDQAQPQGVPATAPRRDELVESSVPPHPMGSMKISDLVCETKEVLADAHQGALRRHAGP
jgi:hypothetical protein